jgi:hypothetical protein
MLLGKMHTILNTSPAFDVQQPAGHRSLNIRTRRDDLVKIMEQNQVRYGLLHAMSHRFPRPRYNPASAFVLLCRPYCIGYRQLPRNLTRPSFARKAEFKSSAF